MLSYLGSIYSTISSGFLKVTIVVPDNPKPDEASGGLDDGAAHGSLPGGRMEIDRLRLLLVV